MSEHSYALKQKAQLALGHHWGLLLTVGRCASDLGFSAYAVGGIPRDLLLDRPIRDLDITIEGDAQAVATALGQSHGGTVQVHAPFLTATWTPEGGPSIDMASTRSESYPTPGELPTVTATSLANDLQRRDFTVNTLALSLSPDNAGTLKATGKALEDLENQVLRVLHKRSFFDDPTRIIRAARFATRLKYTLHPDTQAQLLEAIEAGCIQSLGRERLGNELERIFQEANVPTSLQTLQCWGVLHAVHAHVQINPPALLEATEQLQKALQHHKDSGWSHPSQTDAWWALLATTLPREARAETTRLIPGNRHQQALWLDGPEQVAKLKEDLGQATLASEAGESLSNTTEAIRTCLWASGSNTCRHWLEWWATQGTQQKTAVNGKTLLSRGLPAGPKLGLALQAAQHACWNGDSTEAQLIAALSVFEAS